MTDCFEINSGNGKRAIFDSPKVKKDGWIDRYRLTLESPCMNAVMEVENPPYGVSLTEYLSGLASNWDGWEGVKGWECLEGEFSIETTMSKLGHATMKITMNIYGTPSDWVAIAELDIEAGQLEVIAKHAKLFFNE
jgi:hypothetical protein